MVILDYRSQQAKLMPLLASCYAFHFAKDHLIARYAEMKRTKEEDAVADVHCLSAGLKAYVTSYTAAAINTCREACGGCEGERGREGERDRARVPIDGVHANHEGLLRVPARPVLMALSPQARLRRGEPLRLAAQRPRHFPDVRG